MATNNKRLRQKIDKSGLTITHLANKMSISRESLYNKLNGDTEFKASEIVSLATILGLTPKQRDEIFLTNSVK